MAAYPDWMTSMFKSCPLCEKPIGLECIDSVGVGGLWKGRPNTAELVVMASCIHCQQHLQLRSERDEREIADAVACHYMVVSVGCNPYQGEDESEWKVDGGGHGGHGDDDEDGEEDDEDEADPPRNGENGGGPMTVASDELGTVHPSRRKEQPVSPITDAEIQRFLNMIRRTSFRRNTKGFRKMMKRLGIDI